VTISISGTTAFVSAPQKTFDGMSQVGAVDVYVKSGNAWSFQAELTANDRAEGDEFGVSIATTKDGSTVVVGAATKTVAGKLHAGAAYVFVRSGTTWKQRAELTGTPSGRGNEFGAEVAMNGTGTYIAIAAPLRSVAGQRRAGAVYVFKRDHLAYPQYQVITEPTPAENHYFGWALVVKEAQVVISSPFRTNGDGSTGAVYSYENPTGSYALKTTLTASDGQPNDDFGWAMSESVATMVITSRYHVSAHGTGAVYVFTHSDKTDIWTPRPPILPPDGSSIDDFGDSLSIANNTIAIGDPNHEVGGQPDQGAVYIFTGAASTWTQQAELADPDPGAYTEFGHAVASSTDAVLVSEPVHDVNGLTAAGLVDVFASS
jgi:hypothetical protein